MSDIKRVCVVLTKDQVQTDGEVVKAGDRVMKTTRSYAAQLVATGEWAYTTKSKLRSFINKNRKLTMNMHTLGVIQTVTGKDYPEQRLGRKVVVVVPTFKHVHKEKQYPKKPHLFSKEQALSQTGQKIIVVAY